MACIFTGSRAYLAEQIPGQVAPCGPGDHTSGNDTLSRGSSLATQGFKTFQDEIYFPVRALITGANPYSATYQDFHPDGFSPVTTSPTVLALGSPFGFLSVRESQWIYLAFCFLMAILVTRFVFLAGVDKAPWSMVLVVAGLMIVSRPGVNELLGVGVVFPVMFGFATALQYARRSSLASGFGFLITTSSLVFAVPLAILMFFRRDFRGLAWGVVLTVAVWAVVALVLSRGHLSDLRDVCVENFAQPWEVLHQAPELVDVELACWQRIDLSPAVAWLVDEVRLPGASEGQSTLGLPFGIGTTVAIVCLTLGGICLLLEKRGSQREGLSSRSGLLIVLVTLLALPHPISHGLLIWLLLTGLLVGFRSLVVGLYWPIRLLVVVLLIGFVFNFISPQSVVEHGFLNQPVAPDTWQMQLLASLNPLLLGLAAVLVGLSCLASQLFSADPPAPLAVDPPDEPALSDRQRSWEKLRGK